VRVLPRADRNAGGSRARSRQPLVMRNKVYNVNALTAAG
jgi:hypothetical protein